MRATNISVSAATNSTRAIGGCPFRIQAVPFLPNLCEPTVQPITQNAPSTTADAPHDPPRPVVRNVHWRSARIIVDGSGPTISDLERHREYPLTVLLAEDDAELRRLLEQSLRSDGFKVIAIGSGHKLAQALTGLILGDPVNFDVLVSNVRMPGWPAFSALNGLRCAGYHVPAVFLTACPGPEVELLASELGACLLTKPVDLDELYRAVLSRQPAGARIAAELGMNQGR